MNGITSALGVIGVSAVGAAAKKLVAEIFDYAKKQLGDEKKAALKALTSAEIGKRIYATINVKTLWNVEKEVSLFEFYYPSRVLLPGSPSAYAPRLASELCVGSNLVIEGTAGQGKSIFLRYLYGRQAFALDTSKVLPVFIELRRVMTCPLPAVPA